MQDPINVKIVKGRGWWSFLSSLIWISNHLCSVLYSFPIDCIGAKCLTKCQSRLGIVRPSLGVSFWFLGLFSCKLWILKSTGVSRPWPRLWDWKVAQILESQAHVWGEKSLVACMPWCVSVWSLLDTPLSISRERLRV